MLFCFKIAPILSGGQIIAERTAIASSLLQRTVGLIALSRLETQHALIIPNCRMVHTCFLKFEIDLIFYDKEFQVVALREKLRPWRSSAFVQRAAGVIELPGGSIANLPPILGSTLQVPAPSALR